jgi:Family of unknown function (DUF5996)
VAEPADTLHTWMQIAGKTRLALAPRENHWWHVPLYVSARGLTTTAVPYGTRTFEVAFDLLDHRLVVRTSDGAIREAALRPQAVAGFYREYMGILSSLGIAVKLWPVPWRRTMRSRSSMITSMPLTTRGMPIASSGSWHKPTESRNGLRGATSENPARVTAFSAGSVTSPSISVPGRTQLAQRGR